MTGFTIKENYSRAEHQRLENEIVNPVTLAVDPTPETLELLCKLLRNNQINSLKINTPISEQSFDQIISACLPSIHALDLIAAQDVSETQAEKLLDLCKRLAPSPTGHNIQFTSKLLTPAMFDSFMETALEQDFHYEIHGNQTYPDYKLRLHQIREKNTTTCSESKSTPKRKTARNLQEPRKIYEATLKKFENYLTTRKTKTRSCFCAFFVGYSQKDYALREQIFTDLNSATTWEGKLAVINAALEKNQLTKGWFTHQCSDLLIELKGNLNVLKTLQAPAKQLRRTQ